MLLRRVIAHLKNQEWTAIVIDLCIVVVGVFIGIQVANWNEDRLVDRQAAVFSERLREDLRAEAWSLDFRFAYYDDVLDNADAATVLLAGQSEDRNEALLIHAYRATQYTEPPRRRATFDELVSTGNIALIRDATLRDTAIRVYTTPMFDRMANEAIGSDYRRAFRLLMPTEIQRALGRQCGDRHVPVGDFAAIVDSLDYPCATGLPQERIDEAARLLRSNAQLLSLLQLRIADIETRFGDLEQHNKDIVEGLRAINAYRP